MNKKMIFVIIFLLFITGCKNIKQNECNDFKDCLPSTIHPGDTGCGGCYPDGNLEICYELDPTLCESYKQNYSCVDGFCSN